jgi:hypothetical protein
MRGGSLHIGSLRKSRFADQCRQAPISEGDAPY